MKKYTEGPWRHDRGTIRSKYNIGHVNSHGTTEGKANAHLIAAAPELLEALENMVEKFEVRHTNFYSQRKVIAQAKTIIKKAKGETKT